MFKRKLGESESRHGESGSRYSNYVLVYASQLFLFAQGSEVSRSMQLRSPVYELTMRRYSSLINQLFCLHRVVRHPDPAPLPCLWVYLEIIVFVDVAAVFLMPLSCFFMQGNEAFDPAPLPSLWAHHEKMVVVDQSAVLFTQGSAASRSSNASQPMGSPREDGRR
jgi:hypothetical protein